MKFGKTFLSHQIPEWSIYYMNYKGLKKLIKTTDRNVSYHNKNGNPSDIISGFISEFFFELDRDIEKVDGFYNSKYNEYKRRLFHVVTILGYNENSMVTHKISSSEELDEVISILLELRTIFRNLKWFGDMNHKGFVKILKKLDKKLSFLQRTVNDGLKSQGRDLPNAEPVQLPTNNKENYLHTRVDALPFANEVEVQQDLKLINKILIELGAVKSNEMESGNESENPVKSFEFLKVGNRDYSSDHHDLERFYNLIEENDFESLLTKLNETPVDSANTKFLISLLIKACLMCSTRSTDAIFSYLVEYTRSRGLQASHALFDPADISGKNFFHLLVISIGKLQSSRKKEDGKMVPGESTDIKRLYVSDGAPDGSDVNGNLTAISESVKLITEKVDISNFDMKHLLIAKDNYSRTPLHYVAQYGLESLGEMYLYYIDKWDLFGKKVPIDSVEFWGDKEGLTPIHLSVIGKHPQTTKCLLIRSHTRKLTCNNILLLALRLNSPDILEILLDDGNVDVNYTDFEHSNETALYMACKLNFLRLAEILLQHKADTEIGESIFGWTPIFIAASEGYLDVVKLLLAYGCRYDLADESGWLPIEHASLRGHLEVAQLLKPSNEELLLYDQREESNKRERRKMYGLHTNSGESSSSSVDKLPETNRHAVDQVFKQLKRFDSSGNVNGSNGKTSEKAFKPIKSFGHRYLSPDESLILITLGSTDLRDPDNGIELNKLSMEKAYFTELDTALSLCVTCRNKDDFNGEPIEPPVIVDLPLEDQHGSATDPITFKLTKNMKAEDTIITFDIIPTYQYPHLNENEKSKLKKKDKNILGRAVATLQTSHTKVGKHFSPLNKKTTVPIIEATSLDILGKINFEYLCITSFSHPNMKVSQSETYWKQLVSTRVIGHRGLGKNFNNWTSLQLGENTVESFIAAASLGASYVEFDVQLTKDFVPVVYHDFTVAESGVDIPMHNLTVEQFLGLNEEEYHPDEAKKKENLHSKVISVDDEVLAKSHRPRSISSHNLAKLNNDHDFEKRNQFYGRINPRMKLTKTWKDKGFKGNYRGLSIASNFVTLKDLFKKLPENVGFNIELKYPMLDEAEHETLEEIAINTNLYVDTILKIVYDENITGRDIIFSSFNPDICLLLSLKQPSIPVLFLTEGGTQFMADIRASSLQNAIRFSKNWNLFGIVCAAKTLVLTPRLAKVVKSSGLVCVTYGVENNSPEAARIQMKAGVDAVIVDKVLAVREGLRKDKSLESEK